MAKARAAVASAAPLVLSTRVWQVLACDVRAELRRIAVPILYIQAKRDRLIRASLIAELRRFKPDLALIATDGPHLLFQREPRRGAEVVSEFVRSFSMSSAGLRTPPVPWT